MSRNLKDDAIIYLANTTQVKIANLIKIELATAGTPVYMYVTDYANDIVWDGHTYEAGKVTKVGQLRQTQGITNYKLSVDIAGEFQVELDRGLVDNNSESYVGREVEVLRAYLDASGAIIPFDVTTEGPMQYFIGDISSINISESVISGSSTVTWECAGKFQDFELINGRITDDIAHRGLSVAEDGSSIPSTGAKKESYKTDTGFQHANQTIDLITQYTTSETRYRTKTSWFGFKTKVIASEVEVFNTLELGVSLAAKALPKVYGVRKVPGIPIFVDVLKDNSALYVVYAFCEGEVDSILNLYLDDGPIICSSSQDGLNRVCLGNQANGDTLSAYSSQMAEDEILLLDGEFDGWVDEEGLATYPPRINLIPPTDPDRLRTTGTEHGEAFTITNDTGRRWVKIFHGKSDQEACTEIKAQAAAGNFQQQDQWLAEKYPTVVGPLSPAQVGSYWDEFSTLTDTCYAVLKVDITEDTKIPVLDAVVSGKLIDTYNDQGTAVPNQYTLNPVWQLLDYITDPISGGGLDSNLIDTSSFKAVADSLDQVTTTYENSFVTYWRYLGWKNLPDMTNAIPDPQKTKMQTNTVVQTDNTVTKNISGMLKQFDGTLNILGGKYHLSVESNNAPIANILSNEVIGAIKTKDLSSKNKWNSIQATIVNPAQGWGTTQINFFNSAYLAADNNIAKKGNIVFNNLTNYYTAREWAQVQLSKSRYSREITFTTYYKYSYLYPNANITFTYDRFNYDEKVFRVKTCVLQPDGLVQLTLEDYDESIYDVSDSNDNSGENTPIVPNVLPPRGLEFISLPSTRLPSLTGESFEDVNGLLIWDVDPTANVLRYDVRDWLQESPDYEVTISTVIEVQGVNKHFIRVGNLVANTPYIFKVRTISGAAKTSKWTTASGSFTSISQVSFSNVQNFKTTNSYDGAYFLGTELQMSWDTHINPAVTEYEIDIYTGNGSVFLRKEYISTGFTEYEYSLEDNIEDYTTITGNVGAYRSVSAKIRATNAFEGTVTGGVFIISEWTNLIEGTNLI
jgi:hypothetical protein